MSTKENSTLTVSDIPVEIVRKDIKNLHIGVYPPDGRVRVAAPLDLAYDAIQIAVIERLGWIKRQIAAFQEQRRESEWEMTSGESHYLFGHRYRLDVVEQEKGRRVEVNGKTILTLYAKRGDSAAKKEQTLLQWYREQLNKIVPPIIEKWEDFLGVKASDWGLKRMKTRWGTCNPTDRRIWLNVELAKHPPHLLEYVVVHELAHLIDESHGKAFEQTMDRALPRWRTLREELNNSRIGNFSWK